MVFLPLWREKDMPDMGPLQVHSCASTLKHAHKFNLRDSETVGCHLRCDFFQDEEGHTVSQAEVCLATATTRFTHTLEADNPADVLSEHWRCPSAWPTLHFLHFTWGETAVVPPSWQPETQPRPLLDSSKKLPATVSERGE